MKEKFVDFNGVIKYNKKLNSIKELEKGLIYIKDDEFVKRRKDMIRLLYKKLRMDIILDDIDYNNIYYSNIMNDIKEGVKRNTLHK